MVRSLGIASLIGLASCASAAGAPRAELGKITLLGGQIEVTFEAGPLDVSRADLTAWVSTAASAVTAYFGRFPAPRYRIVIEPVSGRSGVLRGTTWAQGGAHSRIHVGEHTRAEDLERDWIMTHEMIHTAFPDQPPAHHWIEEGIATYVEPLARSWIGHYPPAKVWTDLVDGLPNGLPGDGDRGLDHTQTWGRTYWGGALFCLIADMEIRERTTAAAGSWMPYAGSWRPAATIRSTGRSSARSARGTRRSACRCWRRSTRR